MRATQIRDLPTGFAFFDDRQDLLVRELAPFHRSSSATEDPHLTRGELSGAGQLATLIGALIQAWK